jgi:AcrR family transcriptional regulator
MTGRAPNVKTRHIMTSPDSFPRQGYHHGNLREALIASARELIGERGPAGFTLIEAARRAGVSAAAPYRHFKDREALVAEVSRRGFEQFAQLLSAAWSSPTEDPRAAFWRMGEAYLSFAREEPGFYNAMFLPASSPKPSNATEAFATLTAAIARIAGTERHGKADLTLLAHAVWALSHGLATLSAAGFLGRDQNAPTPSEVLRAGVSALMTASTGPAARKEDDGPRRLRRNPRRASNSAP